MLKPIHIVFSFLLFFTFSFFVQSVPKNLAQNSLKLQLPLHQATVALVTMKTQLPEHSLSTVAYGVDSLVISVDSLQQWTNQRVKNAKNNQTEQLMIPITKRENGFDCNCPYFSMVTDNFKADAPWVKPVFEDKNKTFFKTNSKRTFYWAIGYFSGKVVKEKLGNAPKESFNLYEFVVQGIQERNITEEDVSLDEEMTLAPVILSNTLWKEVQKLDNLEQIPFTFYYDAHDFEQIYPIVPRAELVLRHKSSDLEIHFKGSFFNESKNEYQKLFNQSALEKNIDKIDMQWNNDKTSLRFSGFEKRLNQYLIFQKWLKKTDENKIETLTVECRSTAKKKRTAKSIVQFFSKQIQNR